MGGVLREEGVRGLFRGLVPTMATIGPFAALFLAVYTQARIKQSALRFTAHAWRDMVS